MSLQPRLSLGQLALLKAWFPQMAVIADLSWGLVDTVVLHVRDCDRDVIVKAEGPANRHIGREIAAHRAWVGGLAEIDRAPQLLREDETANVLVTTYVEGRLVLGGDAEWQADTDGWMVHGIAPTIEAQLRAEIGGFDSPTVTLVPTHGDWQPRNWLHRARQHATRRTVASAGTQAC